QAYNNANSTQDFAVARYRPGGTLDTTFGGDGKVTTKVLAGDDAATALAIQSDGKIVVAGYTSDGARNVFAIVRYRPGGGLDKTFSGDGKTTTHFDASDDDKAFAVAIQSDGKIVAGGFASGHRFAVARYKPGGALDKTFG